MKDKFPLTGGVIPEHDSWVAGITLKRGSPTYTIIGRYLSADDALEAVHAYRLENNLSISIYIPVTKWSRMVYNAAMQLRCSLCKQLLPKSSFPKTTFHTCYDCITVRGVQKSVKQPNRMPFHTWLNQVNEIFATKCEMGMLTGKEVVRLKHPYSEKNMEIFQEMLDKDMLEYCKEYTREGVTLNDLFFNNVKEYGYDRAYTIYMERSETKKDDETGIEAAG